MQWKDSNTSYLLQLKDYDVYLQLAGDGQWTLATLNYLVWE